MAANAASKFMDGSKFLTFRSKNKPAFSFRIPINRDTLFGKYSGAIRFDEVTGKLHLCYGPVLRGTTRPHLSTIVKPNLATHLWTWYVNSGKNLQKKRACEMANERATSYTDLYALPGASYQLSYAEAKYLEREGPALTREPADAAEVQVASGAAPPDQDYAAPDSTSGTSRVEPGRGEGLVYLTPFLRGVLREGGRERGNE